ncbi:MAG: hypothetical protein IJ725_04280, partial [Ruminococcus sp.]|nr:hypothetical protein [Ruminococcus sp.]
MKSNGQIISKLFRNSVISIIAAAIATMIGIVIDGIVIGRFLGEDSMAAYGLVTPVINLATAFSGILATGAQVVCAQRLGSGNAEKARRAFSMCMVVTVIAAAIMMAVFFFFRGDICVLLGARGNSAKLLPLAADYILGMLLSFPCVLLLFEFNSLMRLDGDPNRVIVAVVAMTVLDIAGDLLNALVIHGGMLGMGITTSLSYLTALVIMLLHFTKKDIIFKFSFKGLKLKDLGEILMTGSSSAIGSASSMLRNTVLNQIMVATILSSTAVAALSVVNTVFNFTSSVMLGVSMTTAMIAGLILGEQDRSAAKALVKVSVKASLIVGAVLTVILFAAADLIAGVFGSSDGTKMVELAARGLRFYALSIILYGINVVFINYTQGMRRMTISNIVCFLANFVYIVAPALLMFGVLDTDAVWLAFIIGELATLITIIVMAAVKKRGVPYKIADYLFLKEPFGVADENLFEASISNKNEVIPESEAVGEFCENKGAPMKIGTLTALFVEELSNNISAELLNKQRRKRTDFHRSAFILTELPYRLGLRDNLV